MLLLALETSTTTGSIALVEAETEEGASPGWKILGESTLNSPASHSERLMPALDRLLGDAGRSIRDIQGIALALGPGSFTGLRIGAATAKGLAFALKIPVAGVPTLDALAQNLLYSCGQICPVLDARKKEVYAALFRADGGGSLTKISEDWVISPEALAARIREKTYFLGSGTAVYGEVLRRTLGPLALFAPPEFAHPRAVHVARLSLPKFAQGRTLDLFSFTPAYLRRSEAELHAERKVP